MTFQDEINHIELERKLRTVSNISIHSFLWQKIGLMRFLSTVKAKKNVFQSTGFQAYKTLLKKVSRKIDQWHGAEEIQEKFYNDGDYVELDRSPTKFESSSGSSDGESRKCYKRRVTSLVRSSKSMNTSSAGDLTRMTSKGILDNKNQSTNHGKDGRRQSERFSLKLEKTDMVQAKPAIKK